MSIYTDATDFIKSHPELKTKEGIVALKRIGKFRGTRKERTQLFRNVADQLHVPNEYRKSFSQLVLFIDILRERTSSLVAVEEKKIRPDDTVIWSDQSVVVVSISEKDFTLTCEVPGRGKISGISAKHVEKN